MDRVKLVRHDKPFPASHHDFRQIRPAKAHSRPATKAQESVGEDVVQERAGGNAVPQKMLSSLEAVACTTSMPRALQLSGTNHRTVASANTRCALPLWAGPANDGCRYPAPTASGPLCCHPTIRSAVTAMRLAACCLANRLTSSNGSVMNWSPVGLGP
jgi:hypothetical protein